MTDDDDDDDNNDETADYTNTDNDDGETADYMKQCSLWAGHSFATAFFRALLWATEVEILRSSLELLTDGWVGVKSIWGVNIGRDSSYQRCLLCSVGKGHEGIWGISQTRIKQHTHTHRSKMLTALSGWASERTVMEEWHPSSTFVGEKTTILFNLLQKTSRQLKSKTIIGICLPRRTDNSEIFDTHLDTENGPISGGWATRARTLITIRYGRSEFGKIAR